ncbi:polysaccharide pyruvyl transferase family protein [Gordonia amicalis]|uniref:Polysaccharide pyruvyl transferase family protein n=1 Tax=Gordonia amicalis TaxID=89053 RepID=A0AAE4U7E0_9ACTN|nr:polysaccharide pyruvyl transferase family protein [Gordonia amicalis]MDV6314520.1 polysaccharide pyruvyl transferase family protein [Gordonia amicalis]UPW13462.1 polysaccharide pyruvyl transferase family protein [Gordonia amicalis]
MFLVRILGWIFGFQSTGGGTSRTLVISPVGGGNIGDQALFEASIKACTGPTTAVVKSRDGLDLEADLLAKVEVVELPDLLYGAWVSNWRDLVRFCRLLKNANQVYLVGADTLDGAYNELASVNRLRVAQLSALCGVQTRILGSSWNENPKLRCRKQLQSCARAGAEICLRDPVSYRRVAETGIRDPIITADIVFTLAPDPSSSFNSVYSPNTYCVVNASGLVGKLVQDQTSAYTELVSSLLDRHLSVVLVPHVIRDGGDDLATLREIYNGFKDNPSVTLVDRLIKPTDVLSLVSEARLVVTGRMHLAVMSLRSGTPAVTVATQGKVEGLLESFDSLDLLVRSESGDLSSLRETVDRVFAAEPAIRSRIASSLPGVIRLANKNFMPAPLKESELEGADVSSATERSNSRPARAAE